MPWYNIYTTCAKQRCSAGASGKYPLTRLADSVLATQKGNERKTNGFIYFDSSFSSPGTLRGAICQRSSLLAALYRPGAKSPRLRLCKLLTRPRGRKTRSLCSRRVFIFQRDILICVLGHEWSSRRPEEINVKC